MNNHFHISYKQFLLFCFLSVLMVLTPYLISYHSGVSMPTMYKLRIMVYGVLLPLLFTYCKSIHISFTDRIRRLSAILAFTYSQFITIGTSIYLAHDFSLISSDVIYVSLWLVRTIVYCYVFYTILKYIIYYISHVDISIRDTNINLRRIFFVTLGVRLICFVLFFPCLFDFDGALGLRTMLQPDEVITNHHPYLVQLTHAAFYRLGEVLGNPSFGMGILTLIFIFVSSAIVVYTVQVLQLLCGNTRATKIAGYTLALFPLFPLLSIYTTKDGFFAYSFLLYTATLIKLYTTSGACARSPKYLLLHSIAVLLMCFTRHQGLYIVLLESIYLLILYRRYFLKLLGSILCSLIIVVGFTKFYLPSIDVEQTNKKESYNMLFQQTARYLILHPNDVTDKERNAISGIFNPDDIVKAYKYNITDDVKSYYKYSEGDKTKNDGLIHFRHVNHNGENEALSEYRKAWLSMFAKHPCCYFEATTAVIGGFFYNMGLTIIGFDTTWSNSEATTSEFAFSQFTSMSNICSRLIGYLSNIPILDLFFGISYYNWLALLLIGILLWRLDFKALAMFLPVVLSICMLILCPVATGRYEYPIIIILPLFLTILLNNNPKSIKI